MSHLGCQYQGEVLLSLIQHRNCDPKRVFMQTISRYSSPLEAIYSCKYVLITTIYKF